MWAIVPDKLYIRLAVWVAIIHNLRCEEFVSKRHNWRTTWTRRLKQHRNCTFWRMRRSLMSFAWHILYETCLNLEIKSLLDVKANTWTYSTDIRALSKVLHWSRPANTADFFPLKPRLLISVFNQLGQIQQNKKRYELSC